MAKIIKLSSTMCGKEGKEEVFRSEMCSHLEWKKILEKYVASATIYALKNLFDAVLTIGYTMFST